MERNLHNDDFERLLREKSDEFRMYPSKRIWHSIYNNIHPGNKWPSVAMSITLISVLFVMGYLNTRNTSVHTAGIDDQKNATTIYTSQLVSANNFDNRDNLMNDQQRSYEMIKAPALGLSNKIKAGGLKVKRSSPVKSNGTLLTKALISAAGKLSEHMGNSHVVLNSGQSNTFQNTIHISDDNGLAESNSNDSANPDKSANIISPKTMSDMWESEPLMIDKVAATVADLPSAASIPAKSITSPDLNNMIALNSNDNLSAEDKEWIENYALYNKPATKKWVNKITRQYYFTPSIVYRSLTSDPDLGSTLGTVPFAASSASQDINSAVLQTPSLGLEAGTAFEYAVFRSIKLKLGLQLNFTQYNAHAFLNTHPVATKISLRDLNSNTFYEEFRSTPYANRTGFEAVALHNQTFQISLPIGADFKILGDENLQWNVGLTIQPTFVAGGRAYLLSSDRHNYVAESSMLNKWNLNAGFETFISYKTKGLIWQIGPQYRTQLFTTNSRKFAIEEKLMTYGLKFGVSKTIK